MAAIWRKSSNRWCFAARPATGPSSSTLSPSSTGCWATRAPNCTAAIPKTGRATVVTATVGRPNELAAAAASEAKVQISTIAFGTDDGFVVVEGRNIPVPVNRDALATIADATDGQAFEAATAKELRKVYADIGSSIGFRTEEREVTAWVVGLALAFALAAAGGSLLWSSRLP